MRRPQRLITLTLVALAVMAILMGCGGGPPPPSWTDANAYIDITSDATFLFEQDGDTATVSAVVRQRSNDQVIADAVVSFASEAPDVVTVDAASGRLTARTSVPNSATIVASYGTLTPAHATAVVAELADRAVFVPFDDFTAYDPDTGEVILQRTPLALGLQVGDVLISGDRAGLLVRVLAVDVQAGRVVLQTEPADLTDAFDELDVVAVGAEVEYEAFIDDDGITVLNERGEVVQRSLFGFTCKTEAEQPITVTITGASITPKLSFTPTIAIKITRSGFVSATVERFDMFVEGVVRVDARSGSVAFDAGVAGKITCERKLGTYALAFVPIVGPLGAAPTVTPSVGLELKGEATLGSVSLTGPTLDEGVSSTMGVGYSAQSGFRVISQNERVGAGLSWPRYDASLAIAFKATVEPFLKGTVNVSGALGPYTFADFGLVEAKVYGGAELEMTMPFVPTQPGYAGPAWKFYVGVYGGLDPLFEKIDEFQKFINRVGIKIQVTGFGPELFKGELPLATSPKPTVAASTLQVEAGENVDFTVDGATSARVEFMAYLVDDQNAPGTGLSVAEVQTGPGGTGSASWTPGVDDEGTYEVHALAYQSPFGDIGFPYGGGNGVRVTVGEGVSLTIDPSELLDGVVDEPYDFELIASGVPEEITSVTFEWSFGVGAPGSRAVSVSDGEARTTVSNTYPTPGTYTLNASVRDGTTELATATAPVQIAGVVLTITPPGLSDGEVDVLYTFDFTATGLPDDLSQVTFNWTFGVGAGGTGQATASVSGGQASTAQGHSYSVVGAYGLVVDVRGPSGVLAQHSVTVVIGEADERDFDLTICDVWSVSQQGGQGVTIDTWDISMIPPDSVFDIEYDAYSIPDKYLVDYAGSRVLDTGWRGSSSYEGNPLYPGGIAGPGWGSASGFFTKVSADSFTVTVIGPQSGTAWNYRVRCR